MSNEIVQAKTLEQRVGDKILESLADIMTAEDIKQVVEKGVEKFLFEPRQKRDQYGRGYTAAPPLVEEIVDGHLKSLVSAGVEQWLKDNPEKLQEAVDHAVQLGAATCFVRIMDERLAGLFPAFVQNAINSGYLPRM